MDSLVINFPTSAGYGYQQFTAVPDGDEYVITHAHRFAPERNHEIGHAPSDEIEELILAHLDQGCTFWSWRYGRKGKGKVHRIYLSFWAKDDPIKPSHESVGCGRYRPADLTLMRKPDDPKELCGNC